MILEYNIFNKYREVRYNFATNALINHLKKASKLDKLDKNYYNKLRKIVNNEYIDSNSHLIDLAVKTNDENIVEILLDSRKFHVENNTIILATQESNSKIIKVLLKKSNINWNYIINDDQYPNFLLKLAVNNRLDILKIILDSEIIQNILKKRTILDILDSLISRGKEDFLMMLLPYCIRIGKNNNRLLCTAIEYNRQKTIAVLLKNEDVLSEDMYNPFIKSIKNDNNSVFDVLINYINNYEPDGDFGITDIIEKENYYMLDKILNTIDWTKQMKKNTFWKYNIQDISNFLKKYFENEYINKLKKHKVYEILRKYPIFFNQLKPDFYNNIKPKYTSRKINKFYDEDNEDKDN